MSRPQAAAAGQNSRNSSVYDHRVIDPIELPAIMRKHIYTGCMGTTYVALIAGMFFVAFGRLIGMTPAGWGIYYAVIQFAVVGQLISAYYTNRHGQRKKLWFRTAFLSRSFRMVALGAAFMLHSYSPALAATVLIVLLVPASFFGSLAFPPWQSWLTSIIPAKRHGWFMGRRGAWVSLGTLAVVIPCAALLDWVGEGRKLICLMIIFAVAQVLGYVDLMIHRTIPEPRIRPDREARFFREIFAPLKDRTFRPFIRFTCAWSFATMLGGSMAMIYILNHLGLEKNFLGGVLLMIGAPLVLVMLISKRLGVLIDRIGTRRVLIFGHLLWGCLPILWIMAMPETVYLFIGISVVLMAVGSRAAMMAADKIRTRSAPPERTATYAATSMFFGALGGGLGALVGGQMVQWMEGFSFQVGSKVMGGFEVVFLTSMCLRLGSVLLARSIREPKMAGEPVLPMVQQPEKPAPAKGRPRRGVA